MEQSNLAPEPEGPEEVRAKFDALNLPSKWTLFGQVRRLASGLDLKVGTTVLVIAEALNAFFQDAIQSSISVPPSAGWIIALFLPLMLGFFHRKQKDQSPARAGKLPGASSTPEAVSETVKESRRSSGRLHNTCIRP